MGNGPQLLGNMFDIAIGETRRRIERDKVEIMKANLARQEGKLYTLADYGNGLVCKTGTRR
jgi:hypothetical protein